MELIGQGLTNRQIGERLLVSEKTVKDHVSMLFASLGMKRRTQVAADHLIRGLCTRIRYLPISLLTCRDTTH